MALLSAAVALAGVLGVAPAPGEPIRLQALVATSGAGVEALLDGNQATGWRPVGDPAGEGVLFRFEEPVRADVVDVRPCGEAGSFFVTPIVNGGRPTRDWFDPTKTSAVTLTPGTTRIRSLFLKIEQAAGRPCIGEVSFRLGDKVLPVLPPRNVAGSVEATSTLSPAAAYHPSYLFDHRLDFGWVEGAKGTGAGEAVTVTLDAPLQLTALELWNGYQRSPVHFEKNARARKIAVSLDGAPPIALELKDAKGPQRLTLPAPVAARRIRIEIVSVYPGTKYPDLVLSELRFWDAAGPVGIAVKDELGDALAAAVKGSSVAAILGKNLTSVCDDDGPDEVTRTLKLRGDHTFVAYEGVCYAECVTEVFDGTWVPVAREGPWTEIELFGRRHEVRSTYNPYGENPTTLKETDRIAGGRVRIALLSKLPPAERDEWLAENETVSSCISNVPRFAQSGIVVSGAPFTPLFAPDER